jgi:hypothetical protein
MIFRMMDVSSILMILSGIFLSFLGDAFLLGSNNVQQIMILSLLYTVLIYAQRVLVR